MSCLLRPSTTSSTQRPSCRHRSAAVACPGRAGGCPTRCQAVQGFSRESCQPGQATCSQPLSVPLLSRGLHLLLAGSVALNTLAAGPLLLLGPLPASANGGDPQPTTVAVARRAPPAYTVADAPSVHAEAEVTGQLQWWQEDQQVTRSAVAVLEPAQPPEQVYNPHQQHAL